MSMQTVGQIEDGNFKTGLHAPSATSILYTLILQCKV